MLLTYLIDTCICLLNLPLGNWTENGKWIKLAKFFLLVAHIFLHQWSVNMNMKGYRKMQKEFFVFRNEFFVLIVHFVLEVLSSWLLHLCSSFFSFDRIELFDHAEWSKLFSFTHWCLFYSLSHTKNFTHILPLIHKPKHSLLLRIICAISHHGALLLKEIKASIGPSGKLLCLWNGRAMETNCKRS